MAGAAVVECCGGWVLPAVFLLGQRANERVPVSPGTRREATPVARGQQARTHFLAGLAGALAGGAAGTGADIEKSKASRLRSLPSFAGTWAAALAATSWSTMRSPLPSRRWELATGWSMSCDRDRCHVAQS